MDNRKLLGLRIKELRKRASLSQEVLAEKAGIREAKLRKEEKRYE